MKENKNAMLILGLIVVVAVLGLVFMFTNNNKATGMGYISAYGMTPSKVQTIHLPGSVMKIPIAYDKIKECPPDGVCGLVSSEARRLMATKQWTCYKPLEKEDSWTCRVVPESRLPVINLI